MNRKAPSHTIRLSGLDGSNPLAFLTALGTLRTLALMNPQDKFRLGWQIESGAWRPQIESEHLELSASELCSEMAAWLGDPPQLPLFESKSIRDNLTLSPAAFGQLARLAVNDATENPDDTNLEAAYSRHYITGKRPEKRNGIHE